MIFTHEHIDQIVAGRKTQTRRVVKHPATGEGHNGEEMLNFPCGVPSVSILNNGKWRLKWQVGRDYAVSPGRGKPGLWWRRVQTGSRQWQVETADPNAWLINASGISYKPSNMGGQIEGWKPLRIRITDIRREPLQAISEADARAEGCDPRYVEDVEVISAVDEYRALWERINGKGSWDKTGDVWVLTFEVVRP